MQWFGGGKALPVGAQAPDFALLNTEGTPVHLSDSLARGWVVLFFYPKDDSPVCTKQACLFRDYAAEWKAKNVTVLGISGDTPRSHQHFAQKHRLSFPLLSDLEGHVSEQYGIGKLLGLLPERVTFVIAPDGTIRMVYSGMLNGAAHVEKALQFIQQELGKAFS